jgi:putative ubiquitin-RnfH superfamily antitoxin RatB of RatAB toxin-antitoxin module
MTEAAGIGVLLVRAFPDHVDELPLRLDPAATVGDALEAARRAGWDLGGDAPEALGIYGKLVGTATALRDGDRLELLRPLIADPKQRRRARALPPRGG